jgi:outer membrane protein OmpA-like peptidoglycan-associated protein
MSRRIAVAGGASLAAVLVLSVMPARAETLYFGAEGGWTLLQDQKIRGAGLPSGTERFDSGFAVGARIGYEEGPWRFETEYAYRRNEADRITLGGASFGNIGGSRQAHAFLANLIYEIDFGWPVKPHIGAGIGGVYMKDKASAPGLGTFFNDNTWEIGYQGIGGLRYDLTQNIAVDLDYRYFATTDARFHVPGTSATYKTGYSTHNVMASIVYRLGPPAPPPPIAAPPPLPPSPPVAERRVFLIFFDWDKSTITPDGMRIIEQAAAAYRAGTPVQIQVTGYTDRSGSPGYNQRLSERRAAAVADALTRLGVPRSDMAVSGHGENDNRVPTADGVREPQNRRVEIVFP